MHTLDEWQQWYQSVSAIEPPPRVPHRPSEDPLLEAWDNRLAAPHGYFDICIAKHIGHARVADEKSIASLRVEQGLAKPVIEKAVGASLRAGCWPYIAHSEHIHLTSGIQ